MDNVKALPVGNKNVEHLAQAIHDTVQGASQNDLYALRYSDVIAALEMVKLGYFLDYAQPGNWNDKG